MMSGGYGGYGGSYISPATSGGSSKGSGSSQSQQSTQVLPSLMAGYNQLLGLNQQNYGNTLNAYTQGQNQLSGGLPGNYASYGQTLGGVGNTLGMGGVLGQNDNWGVAKPAYDAINKTFEKSEGDITRQLTDSGLGNTTYGGNLQTDNAEAKSQAIGGLGAQLAQTYAGYQAQEGNAASAAQMQGLGLQSGLSGAEGGTLGSYRYANTMGSLTGNQGSASSQNSQSSNQGSTGPRQSPQTGGPAGITGGNGATIGGGGGGGSPGPSSPGSPGSPASNSGGGGYTPYANGTGGFSQGGNPYTATGVPSTTGFNGMTQGGIQSLTGNQYPNGLANQSGQNGISVADNPPPGLNGGFSPYSPPYTNDLQGGNPNASASNPTGDATGTPGVTSPVQGADGSSTITGPSGQTYTVPKGVPTTPPRPGMQPRFAQGEGGKYLLGWFDFGASKW